MNMDCHRPASVRNVLKLRKKMVISWTVSQAGLDMGEPTHALSRA